MYTSNTLSLLLAAAGTVVAQSFTTTTTSTATSTSAAASSTVTTGELGDAQVISNNPPGVAYKATLPSEPFFKDAFPNGGNIQGEVSAVASPDGKGVVFSVKLSNLPKVGGPFPYHIHVAPVPANGNCTETLAHLDPYIRGETPACNKDAPATCQVGDLSGKHGTIPADQDSFETTYTDLYASTVDGIGAFFGNRSLVIHYPNKTRITCASFEKVAAGSASLPGTTVTSTSTAAAGGPTYGSNSTATITSATFTTGAPSSTSGAAAATSSHATAAAAGVQAGVAGVLGALGAAAVFML